MSAIDDLVRHLGNAAKLCQELVDMTEGNRESDPKGESPQLPGEGTPPRQSKSAPLACSDCGKHWPDYELFERRGRLYGSCCLLKTADRQAYEKWFVEPNS